MPRGPQHPAPLINEARDKLFASALHKPQPSPTSKSVEPVPRHTSCTPWLIIHGAACNNINSMLHQYRFRRIVPTESLAHQRTGRSSRCTLLATTQGILPHMQPLYCMPHQPAPPPCTAAGWLSTQQPSTTNPYITASCSEPGLHVLPFALSPLLRP